MKARSTEWTAGLCTGALLLAVMASPLMAQTPTPTRASPQTAALPPGGVPEAGALPGATLTPTPTGQTPPPAPTQMRATQAPDGASPYVHLKWVWDPAPAVAQPGTASSTADTLPIWRYLLNRTADGTTTQDMVDVDARACASGTGPSTPALSSTATSGSLGATTRPAPAAGTTYCAELACPGPGAYVTLLQAVTAAGASEPSNVVSFGLDQACARTTYDQALAAAMQIERGEPTAPGPGPVASTPPPTTSPTTTPPAGTPPTTATPPTGTPPPSTAPPPGTPPSASGGPQMEEPTTGPLSVDGSTPESEPGQPTRPEPPEPLQPIPAQGTIVERSVENIKTYEATQAAERKTYEAVLAKYTALSKQAGTTPAALQTAYQEVVKAYGEASQDIMEAYRSALTEWSDLMVAWQAEPAASPDASSAPGTPSATTSNTTPATTGAPDAALPPADPASTSPGTTGDVPAAATAGGTTDPAPLGPVETTHAPHPEQDAPAPATPETTAGGTGNTPPAPAAPATTGAASGTTPASSLGAAITVNTRSKGLLKKGSQQIQIVLGSQTPAPGPGPVPAEPLVVQPDGTSPATDQVPAANDQTDAARAAATARTN